MILAFIWAGLLLFCILAILITVVCCTRTVEKEKTKQAECDLAKATQHEITERERVRVQADFIEHAREALAYEQKQAELTQSPDRAATPRRAPMPPVAAWVRENQ